MNWIRENKFLTAFIAVLVIGTGGLGYLLYTAWGTYSDVTDQYTQQATDLHNLQSLTPYPDQANLAKFRAERDQLIDTTGTLAASLAQMVLPIDELTPSAFQDKLRDTVSTIVAKAGRTGVKLPDKFAMDFDRYQTSPPPAAAAGPLGRQLAALEIAMNILLDEHVDDLISLKRTPLAQEGGTRKTGPRGAGPGENLVEKVSFDVRFTAGQAALQKVLNDFAASGKQFFITRAIVVENTDPKPVSKSADTSAPAPAPAATGASPTPAPAPDTSSAPTYLKFVVGTEKQNIAMRIDMVSFNPPEKAARKGAPRATSNP